MQQAIEFGRRAADPAAHRDRHALAGRFLAGSFLAGRFLARRFLAEGILAGEVEMRQNAIQQIAVEFGERHSDHLPQTEEFRRVGARLNDSMIRLADDQQRAMRLDRAGEMDFFPFAVRKIGRSERWGSVRM